MAAKNEFPTSSIPLAQELHLCLQCAERYCDNYVAWSQRCWLISQFMSDDVEKLLQELQEVKQWLWMHISDYCCFHYRQQLLKHLKKIWWVAMLHIWKCTKNSNMSPNASLMSSRSYSHCLNILVLQLKWKKFS